jgi:hypothetical protein
MTSASLSSCVDTDEPDSLEALRNAKAEEIRANAGLISAKAEVEKAYVAVVNAKAAFDQAKVAGEEATSAMKQYQAALDKAVKDQAIAEIQAGSADNIEAAKIKAETEKIKAEAGKITNGDNPLLVAKGAAEAAAVTYKTAVDKAKLDLAKEELAAAFNMARLEAETAAELGTETKALQTAYNNWKTAVTALETAQDKLAKAYAQAVKDPKTKNELTETVAQKKQAVDDAQNALDKFNKQVEEAKAQGWLQGESVWKILVDEVNGYKTIVNNNKQVKAAAAIKKEMAQERQDSLQDVVDNLKKAYDKITENAVNALNDFKKAKVKIEIPCANSDLQSAQLGNEVECANVKKKKNDDGTTEETVTVKFTWVADPADASKSKYVSDVEFRKDDIDGIKNAANAFKDKVKVFATDQFGQNSRAFTAIKEKFESSLNDLKKTVETNTNSLKNTWQAKVNAYQQKAAGTDQGAYNTAVGELQSAVSALFGSNAGDYAAEDWTQFTTLNVYDQAVAYFTAKEKKANSTLTDEDAMKLAWSKLGQFGALKQAEYNNNNRSAQVAVLNDADAMVKDNGEIDKIVTTFQNNLNTESAKVTAFQTSEAGKAAYDEWKKVEKELNDDAKPALTKAKEEYDAVDFQQKYANEKYDFFINDNDSPVKEAIANGAIKKDDATGLLSIPAPSAPQALVDAGIIENGNIKTEAALASMKATKEKELANAKIELEEAEEDLKNFDLGTYGKKEDIDPLVEAVNEAEVDLAKKEAEYKKELSYLGK